MKKTRARDCGGHVKESRVVIFRYVVDHFYLALQGKTWSQVWKLTGNRFLSSAKPPPASPAPNEIV